MSKSTCSQCEKEVSPNWRYCRFCGNKLEIKEESPPTEIKPEEIEEEISVKDQVDFDRKMYYDVLSTRAERALIMKRKSSVRKEIDALLEQHKAGLLDEEHILPQIKELRAQVKEINENAKKYSDLPQELPIETLNDEIDAAKKRIKKIKMLKEDDNIGKDTIKEAMVKAEKSLQMLKEQQSVVFGHLRTWKKELDDNISKVRKDIEHLYVRYKTEEITEETYKEKKTELVRSIENDEEVLQILKKILT